MKSLISLMIFFAVPGCSFTHAAGIAYSNSCEAALLLATRNGSGTEYTGHSYGDSRAVAEDSHYHGNQDQYEGRSGEDIPRGSDSEGAH